MTSARQVGFTLLELLAVVSVLALLAMIAATRIGGNYQQAVLTTTLTKLAAIDCEVRGYAASQRGLLTLRFDLNHGAVECQRDGKVVLQPYQLPDSVTVERFLSSRERKTSGVATVKYGLHGESETYALKVSVHSLPAQWVLVVGGSGQIVHLEEAQEAEEVFRAIKAQSPHAP